jgi:tetratricopeptide (TPR) repeat protein
MTLGPMRARRPVHRLLSHALAPVAVLAGTWLFAASVAAQPPGGPATSEARPTEVFEVRVYDRMGGPAISANGFFVRLGRFVTDRRLLLNATRADVRVSGRDYPVTAVVAEDARAHLVVLAVDLPDGAPAPCRLAATAARPGDEVSLVAREGATAPARGRVERYVELAGLGAVIRTTIAGVAPPGTPLVNARGEVVGIASGVAMDGEADGVYVPAARLDAIGRILPSSLTDWSRSTSEQAADGDAGPYRDAVRLQLGDRFAEAAAAFRVLIGRHPLDADLHVALGVCLEQLGDATAALAAYQRARDTAPDRARTWYRLGVTASDLGDWPLAIDAFTHVGQLAPADAHTQYNLGVALGNAGRYDEEVAAYLRAIRLDPEQPAAYNNLGVAYITLKRYADAAVALERAVKLEPGNADALANRGIALANDGHLAEAVVALRAAIARRPDSIKAHYALGVVLVAAGDEAGARAEQGALRSLDAGRAQALETELARRRDKR